MSDIGADTLQVTPDVRAGKADVNRCGLLAEYVREGDALGMVGGYMSFAGHGGQTRYGATPIADILPVSLSPIDDCVEAPSGAVPKNRGVPDVGLPVEWPAVLGYNRVEADSDADVWATVRDDSFVVVGRYGEGKSFAVTTDYAPHWAPQEFLEWECFPVLWSALLDRVVD